MTRDGEKHSKRAGEPDPGLDPRPYESSNPSQEAVQRSGGEERVLSSLGEGATGDGVEGARTADQDAGAVGAGAEGDLPSEHVDSELVDQPDQPNMGPPHTAPAPRVPGGKRA